MFVVDLDEMSQAFACVVNAAVADDIDQREAPEVRQVIAAASKVISFAESVRLKAAGRLNDLSKAPGATGPDADDLFSAASRGSGRSARLARKRAKAVREAPKLGEALSNGDVSPDHVDVVAQALNQLQPAERALLAGEHEWIAAIAAKSSPEGLAKALRIRVRELRAGTEDEVAKLDRQRRATKLKHWLNNDTGMRCMYGEFDPELGALIVAAIDGKVNKMYELGDLPETCPTDPLDRHHHLQGLAVANLICRRGGGHEACGDDECGDDPADAASDAAIELVVVIDLETLQNGLHAKSRVDVPGDVELPIDTIRRWACDAEIIPAVLNGDGVVLDVGRAQRLATRQQRRALRAMYPTCGVPGCHVKFDRTRIHHLIPWIPSGLTDLINLIPLCHHHHRCAHQGGWKLSLDQDRVLTITYPDGTRSTTPPPHAKAA